ncbi:MAG: B12-binding domain-containing radical SAM protein [Lentisphaerae bacterium RIFOXYC12_FULL_60_16]|nr:MAG: B12-binding domain-containing radical SAM protein [Lentisphaerae bacterium RIFOXYC12_FULL_60_16]OGV75296.1 MAG: B12-binding domain-containing radical SAM protein [Lentisphaerae bacterium RIFOXYB12_FULL_60_10]
MNILLIYPEFPDTFWSFKHALNFVGKRSALPPLGLLTVAAMLPPDWPRRLVDTNVHGITDQDLAWADCAFISAMVVQRESAKQIIDQCRTAGVRVVAGGPLFNSEWESFGAVDHFVLNEAELTLPPFLDDLRHDRPQRIYATDQFADLRHTPIPQWDLLELKRYVSMNIQFSRGCPFNCDFCNVTTLLGHRVRTKTAEQIVAELDPLYALGWRGNVFFVDDNFIGNKPYVKNELLPALIRWRKNKTGNAFFTEASINLADDAPLMDQMVEAGFTKVFIGIETPDEHSLAECSKVQNGNRNLVEDVKRIQRAGLQVQGGFIVGFDHDQPSIFQRQIDFIQKSGIVTAMVGLLQAPAGTRLYERMKQEGRLCAQSSGDNVDGTTNIIPAMNLDALKEGYRHILEHIYSPEHYYRRLRTFLREFRPPRTRPHIQCSDLLALFRSFYHIGIVGRERFHFWALLAWTQVRRPRLIPEAVTLAIYGYHFRKICQRHVV